MSFTSTPTDLIAKLSAMGTSASPIIPDNSFIPKDPHVAERSVILKVITDKPFRKPRLREAMLAAWNVQKPVKFNSYDDLTFIAIFDSKDDADMILRHGPWSFAGDFVSIQRCKPLTPPASYVFDEIDLWIQIAGIPAELWHLEFLEAVCSPLGKIKPFSFDDVSKWGKFVRLKVTFNISKSLIGRIKVPLPSNLNYEISVSYEKLGRFCSFCGKLGHESYGCGLLDDLDQKLEDAEVSFEVKSQLKSLRTHRFGDELKADNLFHVPKQADRPSSPRRRQDPPPASSGPGPSPHFIGHVAADSPSSIQPPKTDVAHHPITTFATTHYVLDNSGVPLQTPTTLNTKSQYPITSPYDTPHIPTTYNTFIPQSQIPTTLLNTSNTPRTSLAQPISTVSATLTTSHESPISPQPLHSTAHAACHNPNPIQPSSPMIRLISHNHSSEPLGLVHVATPPPNLISTIEHLNSSSLTPISPTSAKYPLHRSMDELPFVNTDMSSVDSFHVHMSREHKENFNVASPSSNTLDASGSTPAKMKTFKSRRRQPVRPLGELNSSTLNSAAHINISSQLRSNKKRVRKEIHIAGPTAKKLCIDNSLNGAGSQSSLVIP